MNQKENCHQQSVGGGKLGRGLGSECVLVERRIRSLVWDLTTCEIPVGRPKEAWNKHLHIHESGVQGRGLHWKYAFGSYKHVDGI